MWQFLKQILLPYHFFNLVIEFSLIVLVGARATDATSGGDSRHHGEFLIWSWSTHLCCLHIGIICPSTFRSISAMLHIKYGIIADRTMIRIVKCLQIIFILFYWVHIFHEFSFGPSIFGWLLFSARGTSDFVSTMRGWNHLQTSSFIYTLTKALWIILDSSWHLTGVSTGHWPARWWQERWFVHILTWLLRRYWLFLSSFCSWN